MQWDQTSQAAISSLKDDWICLNWTVCWFSLIKLQLPLMPKILTTVLLLFIQTWVLIRIDFFTKSNAMMLEFSLLSFSNVLVHVLTSMRRAIWFKIGFWTQMISHDVLWCSPGFCFDPLWTATFVGHFCVVQRAPYSRCLQNHSPSVPFATLCLSCAPGQERTHTHACVYLLQGNKYQYNSTLATLTHVRQIK